MSLEQTLKKFKTLEDKGCLGVIRRAFNFTDEPKFFQYSCISQEGKYESSSLDKNKKLAKIKSLGEYLERYCLDNPHQDFCFGPYNELKDSALNPSLFINFRDCDLGFRKNEYIEKVKNSKLRWVKGKDISNNSEILIPAQLVYVDFNFEDEPMIRPRVSTGAATNETLEEAFYSGIMENIERDSYMVSYLSKKQLPKINLDRNFSEIVNYFRRYLLDLHVFETTSDLGIPSFMCLNIDRTELGPAVSVGLKASLNPKEGILGSIRESQQVRNWIRNLWIQKGKPKISSVEDIKEVEDRGFYWYNIDKICELDYMLKSTSLKEFRDINSSVKDKKDIVRHLKDKKVDSYYVDLTAPAFKDAGFFVIKAINPQLHPLFLDEAFPCYFSERLELKEGEINKTPHPFM
ncbi:MAG: YcaO-like family protein [Candidatus Diapherotrites archaeon]